MDSSLRSFAEEFGPLRVWDAGISVLGYPPTWEPSVHEITEVVSYLKG